MENTIIKVCEECETPLKGLQRKYCSRKCHNKSGNVKNQNYQMQQQRGLSRKLHFINLKGGKCEICEYSRNTAALCFHHRDSSLKNFGVDLRAFSNNKIEILEIEVNKCTLLCHNCHMELHHPTHTITLGTSA